jgi:CRP/FNR family transcriptional regulator, cyclic AMP receptor protein
MRGMPAPDEAPIPPLVQALADRGRRQEYRKDALLIQEGDFGDTIYVILAGRLRVYADNADGNRRIILGTYGRGEYVGEMGLDGGPRSANVVTVEKTTCSVISRPVLEAFLVDEPRFAFELITKLIRRVRAATISTKQLALNDCYGNLKRLLESLAGPPLADGSRLIEDPLTYQEIADHLGCTPEMIGRLLRELAKGQYIERTGQHTRLLRPLPPRF